MPPNKPGKTFNNLAKTKQDRIIRAALGEFSQKGYTGANISAIADKVGIAKGSMFQYFGDKKRLFLFLFERTVGQVKNYLKGVRDQTADQDVFTRIERSLLGGVDFIRKHPRIYTLYLKIVFEPGTPLRQEMLRSLRRESVDYLRSLLQTGRERGELRDDADLDMAAFILDAVLDRFLQAMSMPHLDAGQGLYGMDHATAKAKVKDVVDILRQGLGHK